MDDHRIEDKELGRIEVVVNPRSRHIIMRPTTDGLRVTVPPGTTVSRLHQALHDHHDRLLRLKQMHKAQQRRIDFGYRIDTDLLTLQFTPGSRPGFHLNRRSGFCEIVCPADTDFDHHQEWLIRVVTEQLRIQAKELLPQRLARLAVEHGFHYQRVSIQSSHTRWGSCSAQNTINLSLYLMTLPSALIDYVLLHELCHTVHHDHSQAFWTLMDHVTDGQAHSLRQQLNAHHTCL